MAGSPSRRSRPDSLDRTTSEADRIKQQLVENERAAQDDDTKNQQRKEGQVSSLNSSEIGAIWQRTHFCLLVLIDGSGRLQPRHQSEERGGAGTHSVHGREERQVSDSN